jgi:hypothetical protein
MPASPAYEAFPTRRQLWAFVDNIRSTWRHQEGDNLRSQSPEIVSRVKKSDYLTQNQMFNALLFFPACPEQGL